MNIDKFINEYYDRLYRSDENHDSSRGQQEQPEQDLKPFSYKVINILLFSSFIISYILSGVLIFKNCYKAFLISFIVFIIVLILMPIWDNSDMRRHERINAQAIIIEKRIRCLIELLKDWNISLSFENINELIEAAIENKPKHSNIGTFLRFINIIRSGISFYIPIVITIFFCDSIIGQFNLSLVGIIINIFKISIIFLGILIVYAVFNCLYISDIDPHIRKIYHFHDIVISDLRQLNCFRTYYGLDSTENADSSDNKETSAEEVISTEEPIQNIEKNIESTIEKKDSSNISKPKKVKKKGKKKNKRR